MKKKKSELFMSSIEAIKDRKEEWMNENDKMKEIINVIREIIPYYNDMCFYQKKDDDSFQIGYSTGGLLPHRVREGNICHEAIFKRKDMISSKKVSFDPESLSEMCVVSYNKDTELPYPMLAFYAVSAEKEAFDKSDIEFIHDLFERFIE